MSQNLLTSLDVKVCIGGGHFGEVYEAHDRVLGKVAVKILRRHPNETDQDWISRKEGLLQEGQRLKDAEHEHVVRVFQVLESEDGESVYLVMEFCENGSLQAKFERGPMPLRELRAVLTDAALGLQAIHARDMIHRDIKPANILLGAGSRAKLADFGLVTDEIILGYASLKGYTDHLAPEVHQYGLTSTRTDVWAFGMTAYRLLHGQEFYDELPLPRDLVLKGRFAQKLPWLPHIPDEWKRFIRRAMHDDSTCRLQGAADILRNLERLPIDPDWLCSYSDTEVRWTRISNNRRIEVVWQRHSPRRHEWEAKSFPLREGRERRLDGSGGITSRSEVVSGLEKFFDNSRDA